MSMFKQTGLTQQITTTGAGTWLGAALTFGSLCGAVRVVNTGPNPVQIAVWDEPSQVNSPTAIADGTPSILMTLLPTPEGEIMLGPFQGQVWFNAAGVAGSAVQFTPGACSR